MPYYHVSTDIPWTDDFGEIKWAGAVDKNLDENSLIKWLERYVSGGNVYGVLTQILLTQQPVTQDKELDEGTDVTRLAKWATELIWRHRKIDYRKAFIVHGRDKAPAYELALILERDLGLVPVILREETDEGKTIIEKLEENSDVGYAFVIMTPDDLGKPSLGGGILRVRARQNVVFEFGYYLSRLGRKNVCCLLQGDIELPSDMAGIVYKRFNESVRECIFDIVRELQAAGSPIELFRKSTEHKK